MSWHCLPELVGEFSGEPCSVGGPSVPSSSTAIAGESCCGGKGKGISQHSRSGTIYGPSEGTIRERERLSNHLAKWITLLLRQGFRANHTQQQVKEKVKGTKEISGRILSGLYGKWDRKLSCWRMCQGFFALTISAKSSVTWRKRGTMRNGTLYRRRNAGHHINEIGCGFWLGNQILYGTPLSQQRVRGKKFIRKNLSPAECVVIGKWPTPRVSDSWAKKSEGEVKARLDGTKRSKAGKPVTDVQLVDIVMLRQSYQHSIVCGELNPDWVELLMGWPEGWTCINPISCDIVNEWLIGFKQSLIEVLYNETDKGKAKEMQKVWSNNVSQAVQYWRTRKQRIVSSEKLLLFGVCKQQKGHKTTDVALEGTKANGKGMPSVRHKNTPSGTPLRWEQGKSKCIQSTDALYLLPQVSSRYSIQAWFDGSWEIGIPRVAIKIDNCVDRLAAIGNGQVPIVAAVAFVRLALRIGLDLTRYAPALFMENKTENEK